MPNFPGKYTLDDRIGLQSQNLLFTPVFVVPELVARLVALTIACLPAPLVRLSQEALALYPLVPAGLFHSSLLVGAMTSVALPAVMTQAVTTTVASE